MFLVADGRGGLIDTRTGEGLDDLRPMTVRAGPRIGIHCASEVATLNGTVQGLIDGEVMIERSNGSSDGFDLLALVFLPSARSDCALVDDVVAEVPWPGVVPSCAFADRGRASPIAQSDVPLRFAPAQPRASRPETSFVGSRLGRPTTPVAGRSGRCFGA